MREIDSQPRKVDQQVIDIVFLTAKNHGCLAETREIGLFVCNDTIRPTAFQKSFVAQLAHSFLQVYV